MTQAEVSVQPVRKVGLAPTVRSEWIKLRTTRTTMVLVLVAFGLEALIVGLTAVFADTAWQATSDLVTAVTATAIPVALLLGVVGALSITSEHAHGTIRPTFAAMPRRTQVYVAKFLTLTVATLVAGIVVVAGATAGGGALFMARGADIDIAQMDDGIGALVGSVLFMVIVAWLGFALGLLTRSSPLSIVLLILWPLVIENLVGGIFWVTGLETLIKWLPFTAGFMLPVTEIPDDMLSRWMGGAWFAAFSLALLVVGAAVNRQRDA